MKYIKAGVFKKINNCLNEMQGKVAKETTEVIINSLKRDITKKIPEYINQLVPIIEDLAGSIVS